MEDLGFEFGGFISCNGDGELLQDKIDKLTPAQLNFLERKIHQMKIKFMGDILLEKQASGKP